MAKPNPLTATMLADLEVPHELSLSPHLADMCWVASLWLADVGASHSARQLTDGLSLDSSPKFSPDGKSIAFLSNREKKGVNAIWAMDLEGGEASSLTDPALERGVEQFEWSRDSRFVAFLSMDEKTAEQKAKEGRMDDAVVYGQHWEYVKLRVLELATQIVTTLPVGECQVYQFAWSPDSRSIAYASKKTPEVESADLDGTTISVIGLDGHHMVDVALFPGLLEDLCWVSDDLWWRAKYDPSSCRSANAVYKMSLSDKAWSRYGFGEKDCACTWFFPPGLQVLGKDSLVVQVQEGLEDQLHLLPEGKILYDELHEVRGWDTAYRNGEIVVALVKSTGSTPPEVYSIVHGEIVCLSKHGQHLAKLDIATAEPFHVKAQDGSDIDGVLVIPNNFNAPKPWPTIVLVHGGPYQRISCGFDLPNFNWSAWFTSIGYAVLCVNYRGGSSHGEAYTAATRTAAGTLDYSDMVDLVKAGINRGIVDKNRVGLAGWSYGGYLAYIAVTRDSPFHFQAAICGAGKADLDLVIMTNPHAVGWAQLSGNLPWDVDKNNTKNRDGSALWHMQDIKTPILIMHGEQDTNVSVFHAKSFHKGCLRRGFDCDMVLYPEKDMACFPRLRRLTTSTCWRG